ncbi:NAC domain-containing protein 78-like isoform X2 [Bidens hawaiensis]|uniref:NAC domain-containing protein 78-like isoform X2 n=1 Tax=Bidens hawaiensis TaxID=980011 RepID=UPI00404A1B03
MMAPSSLMPGFRFHPTDVELVMYYLKRKILGKKITFNAVSDVNIYEFCPWDLPDKSTMKSGDLEWYFFCAKSKKYSSGGRSNRATESGFWKATGLDRKVKYNERIVATIKTLVFHLGQAGKGKGGQRTNWVMYEYRMCDEQLAAAGIVQDAYVLCKIFEKRGTGPQNGAQYGAPFNEDEWNDDLVSSLDSQAVFGSLGASSSIDHKQKGPATTKLTEPAPSVITNGPISYKEKGPATMNVSVAQVPCGLSVNEPGSSSCVLPTSEMLASDDLLFLDDFDLFMEVPEAVNEDAGIFDELATIYDLKDLDGNDFKTDDAEYMLKDLGRPDDDLGLGGFFVD